MPRLFANQDGSPIAFAFHKSIKSSGQRKALLNNITHNGGIVVSSPMDAKVLLYDDERALETRHKILIQYAGLGDGNMSLEVEPMNFVKRCVSQNRFVSFSNPPDQRQPGRRAHDAPSIDQRPFHRVEYTSSDDENLCRYIALIISDPTRGGRQGNNIYQQLAELGRDSDATHYSWARRHTWHSWRERYRKQKLRLDPIIDGYTTELQNQYTDQELHKMRWLRAPLHIRASGHRHGSSDEEIEEEASDDETETVEGDPDFYVKPEEPERDMTQADYESLYDQHAQHMIPLDHNDDFNNDVPPAVPPPDTQATLIHVTQPPPPAKPGPANTLAAPTPRVPSHPQASSNIPKRSKKQPKNQPRAVPQPVVPEGPYRNTRARSASVEPVALPVAARTRTKGGGRARQRQQMQAVPEQPNSDHQDPHPPIPETIQEQITVANMLLQSGSGVSRGQEPDDLRKKRKRQESSLSSDDAKVDSTLRAESAPHILASNMDDEVKNFTRSHDRARKRRAVSPLPPSQLIKENIPQFTPPRSSNLPVTPPPRKRHSESSSSSFPLEGTLARSHRKQSAHKRKSDVYTPHSSTHAAKYLRQLD